MIPLAFDYVRAESADEALAQLVANGEDAKLLAGGHSLLPLLKLRLAAPSVLIDVGDVSELRYVREEGSEIAIGALTRHHDLETSAVLARHFPLLCRVAALIGDPQVRNRGTIGGSLAHGDAASDLPAAVLVADATMVIQGGDGRRSVRAADFFQGFLDTALEEQEMLVEIRIPKARGSGWSYRKFNRRAQDYAVVAAAVVLGDVPRVSLVNMGSVPIRATEVEAALAAGEEYGRAARLSAEGTDPMPDHNASEEYRRHLACELVAEALAEAGDRQSPFS